MKFSLLTVFLVGANVILGGDPPELQNRVDELEKVDVSKVSRSLELLEDKVENLNVTTESVSTVTLTPPASQTNQTKKLAVCGYQQFWSFNGVITYDHTVAEANDFGVAALDKKSGKFTAPVTGLYEVSAAAKDCYVGGDAVSQVIYLMINNYVKDDDFMNQKKYGSGVMYSPCSGFRYVQLTAGGNLYLKYGRSGFANVRGLKFCVALFVAN